MDKQSLQLLLIAKGQDDVALLRKTLAEADESCRLIHASDLAAALGWLEKGGFDIVLLHLDLPDSQGLEALTELTAEAPDIPIVVVGDVVDESLALDAVRSGAQDYLLKGNITWPILRRVLRYAIERQRMTETLRQSEERFHRMFDDSPVGMALVGEDYRILQANRTLCQMLEYTPEELTSLKFVDFTHPEDVDADVERARRAFAGEIPSYEMEKRYITKGERVVWGQLTASVLRDRAGNALYGLGIVEDITARKQAEAALAHSEREFRSLAENALVGIFRTALDGEILFVNQALADMLGFETPEELRAENVIARYQRPQDRTILLNMLQQAGAVPNFETVLLTREGQSRHVLLSARLEGEVISGMIRDITTRVQAEEALRRSESSLSEAQQIARLGSWRWDIAADRLSWSDELYRVFDKDPAAFTPTNEAVFETIIPEDRPRTVQAIETSLIHGAPFDVECRILDSQGRTKWLHSRGHVTFDDQGNPSYARGTVQDITSRKVAEQEIARQSFVLEAINEVLQEALRHETEEEVARTCLAVAEELTGSKFGFVGELNQAGLFDTIAISNPGWTACTMPDSEATRLIKDMPIRGIDRSTLREGKSRIVNDPASHPDAVGTLEGHPPLTAFLGVPLKQAGHTIGMIGLANKEGGYTLEDQQAIEALSVAFVEAFQRKRAEAELQQRHNELARLYRASEILLLEDTPDFEALARQIVEAVLREFDQSNCSLLIIDESLTPPRLQRVAIAGQFAEQVSQREPILEGRGLVPRAIRSGELINSPDVTADPNYVAFWPAARSELVIPLKVGQRVIGALDLQSSQVSAFSPNDERILSIFVDRAALALSNARSYERAQQAFQQAQQRVRELTIISDFGQALVHTPLRQEEVARLVTRSILRLSGMEECSISLYDPGRDTLTTIMDLSIENGEEHILQEWIGKTMQASRYPATVRAMERGQPVVIHASDEAADPAELAYMESVATQTLVILPLRVKEWTMGIIELESSEEEYHISPAELELVMTLANQAAIALENAQLLSDAQRRLNRMSALREIDRAISGSLDLRLTLDIFLQQVRSQLHVDAASVLLYHPTMMIFEYAASSGFYTSALKHTHLRYGEGFAGMAARERRTIYIPDIRPKGTGFLTSPELKDEKFLTYVGTPLIAKGEVVGVLELFHREWMAMESEWTDFLEMLAGQAAIAIDNAAMFERLQRINLELLQTYDATLEGWVKALDMRDQETEHHTQRVTQMTLRLAQTLGVNDAEMVHIRRGALLHDIGKMAVSDNILLKPGPLTEEEWQQMRMHPVYAREFLYPIAYLRPALDIPYGHHEKWDGSGYPQGLQASQIPWAARIFAVVDVWDALSSDRPYRKAWPEEKVLEYIREQSGGHFDPQVVDAFLKIVV